MVLEKQTPFFLGFMTVRLVSNCANTLPKSALLLAPSFNPRSSLLELTSDFLKLKFSDLGKDTSELNSKLFISKKCLQDSFECCFLIEELAEDAPINQLSNRPFPVFTSNGMGN